MSYHWPRPLASHPFHGVTASRRSHLRVDRGIDRCRQLILHSPIPKMTIPTVSNPSLTFGRPAQARPSRLAGADSGKGKGKRQDKGKGKAIQNGALPVVPEDVEMDTRPYERTMSKREKAAVSPLTRRLPCRCAAGSARATCASKGAMAG